MAAAAAAASDSQRYTGLVRYKFSHLPSYFCHPTVASARTSTIISCKEADPRGTCVIFLDQGYPLIFHQAQMRTQRLPFFLLLVLLWVMTGNSSVTLWKSRCSQFSSKVHSEPSTLENVSIPVSSWLCHLLQAALLLWRFQCYSSACLLGKGNLHVIIGIVIDCPP